LGVLPMADTPSRALEDAVEGLARLLRATLPGVSAQQVMAVAPRTPRPEGVLPGDMRKSAVLLLIYPHRDRLWLPLIRRAPQLRQHAGQYALPGGESEPTDPSLWHTALREAREEIGLDPRGVTCLGALTPLEVPVSNHMLYPFVGYSPMRPEFRLQADEVDDLVELPLDVLLEQDARSVEERDLSGRRARVPFYRYEHAIVWGATAMVLSELEAILRALSAEAAPRPNP